MLAVRDAMRLTMADENRGQWFTRAGRVRDELGESETAMWVRVHELLENPDAMAALPVTVARLKRKRAAQVAARSARVRIHTSAP